MTDNRGLHNKYRVERTDRAEFDPASKHRAGCNLFVLDLDHDQDARAAAAFYADLVRHARPALADDLEHLIRALDQGHRP